VLQHAAAYCSVLQYVAVKEQRREKIVLGKTLHVVQCGVVCCSVLQRVAACCAVVQ